MSRRYSLKYIFQEGEKYVPFFGSIIFLLATFLNFLQYYTIAYSEGYSYLEYLKKNVLGIPLLLTALLPLIFTIFFYMLYIFLVSRFPSIFAAGCNDSRINILYGFVQIIQWEYGYGIVFFKKNQIIDDTFDNEGKGGIKVIYPLKLDSASQPISLGYRAIETDYNIYFNGLTSYTVKILAIWKIIELKQYLYFDNSLDNNKLRDDKERKITTDEELSICEKFIVETIKSEILGICQVASSQQQDSLSIILNNSRDIQNLIDRVNLKIKSQFGIEIESISIRKFNIEGEILHSIKKAIKDEIECNSEEFMNLLIKNGGYHNVNLTTDENNNVIITSLQEY